MSDSNENHSKGALIKILHQARAVQAEGNHCLAVFDLDSTLFDVTPRIRKIIHDFITEPEHQKRFPANCDALKDAEVMRADWGVRDALTRAGLDGHNPIFHETMKDYWRTHFFSNEFLEYDIVYDGAVEFVKALYDLEVDIVYLTGRDVARMGIGTEKVLKKWDFPLDPIHAQMILKPNLKMDDAKFKSDYFAAIPDGKYTHIWLFENEPTNIRLVRKEHSQVEVVFFHSTHSGQHEPPVDLPKIMHYLLD
jgi:hypothetical protein